MQSSTEMRAWVKRVLKVDLDAAGLDTAGADGTPPAAAAGPNGTTGGGPRGGLIDAVKGMAAEMVAAVTGSDPRKDAGAPAERKKALAALDAKNPEAAKQARAAYDKWDQVLGDAEVTPEAAKKAGEDRAAKEKAYADALATVKKAKALPEGGQKKALVARAEKVCLDAKAAADQAAARDDAMLGRTALTKALSHGPLSAETGKPLDPKVAAKLVAAYGQDARMADAAVGAAATAKYPAAIADNLSPMIARAKGGFPAANGEAFDDPGTARKYGQDLLQMGGDLGPDYFARLPEYVASGRQFSADGPGGEGETTWSGMAQKQTVKLAGKLLKPDGTLDLAGADAKGAVGDLLFHPDAMQNKQPALAANVLGTVKLLSDPATAQQAGEVLKKAKAPTNPAAQVLVRGALGKGPGDALDDTGARTAALAAMLKPLDQGAVGSCFATAVVRKVRGTKPLDALQAYADIASKGTYKPAVGPELPAVTSLPPDEDPILRSWEYTAATAAARNADSWERQAFTQHVAAGTELLKGVATKHVGAKGKEKAWKAKKAKLAKAVADAFTFTYDPTSEIPAASDGSSSMGRFVVQRVSDGKEITSQADFEDAMAEVALASLGIAAGSADAAAVEKQVRSPAFTKAVTQGDYLPWQLQGGGYGIETSKAVYGDTLESSDMLPAVGKGPKPKEGDRTRQVLTAFLKNLKGSPGEMVTIETEGIHSFNALPNDPSLKPLKGKDDAETAKKVQANLVDKGRALRDTSLAADRAAWMFDEAIRKEADAEADAKLKALLEAEAGKHRPKAAMKPAALAAAVRQALDAYHAKAAERAADDWKAEQEKAGAVVKPADLAKHKADAKAGLDEAAQVGAKNLLMKDLGAPEFVIADTNWGSSLDHTVFVVAPDPTTGEAKLWQRTDPPGSLAPMGREWVDTGWSKIQ